MISFLFWNLGRNVSAFPSVVRLANAPSFPIDVLFLAECPPDVHSVTTGLTQAGRGDYRDAGGDIFKVRVISRLPSGDFFPHFNNQHGDMTVWNLATNMLGGSQVQIAVVHLLSKAGGPKPEDQQAVATAISREIVEYEDREGCQNTVLVGDLNMNPFEPGMVMVSGFHGTMSRQIARRPDRRWRHEKYRRFYNPMWGLFGDRTPGPSGTHYWESSTTSNQHWHMFDQVLLRPSMMDLLRELQIVEYDGYLSLLDGDGVATKEHLSDHLPIRFALDI
jgi:hypothetical protein